jgi:hypothetical protein
LETLDRQVALLSEQPFDGPTSVWTSVLIEMLISETDQKCILQIDEYGPLLVTADPQCAEPTSLPTGQPSRQSSFIPTNQPTGAADNSSSWSPYNTANKQAIMITKGTAYGATTRLSNWSTESSAQ